MCTNVRAHKPEFGAASPRAEMGKGPADGPEDGWSSDFEEHYRRHGYFGYGPGLF